MLRSLSASCLASLLLTLGATASADPAPAKTEGAAPAGAQPDSAAAVQADPSTPAPVTQPPAPPQTVRLLQGKLAIELPEGFNAAPLPPGDASEGTAGASGMLYTSNERRQVVVVSEAPLPGKLAAADDDKVFLQGAAQGYVTQQKQASAEYDVTAQDSLRSGSLGLQRINARGNYAGTPTLNTSLLAGSGPKLAVVQVISRADDAQSHQALVQEMLQRLPPPAPATRPAAPAARK
ncbi:hypothetical protein [Bordetella trematum]|uniref:hypothetical protein n=1 Tax=Bordetella trematum TaxID=123899 RepID=UPI003988D8CC